MGLAVAVGRRAPAVALALALCARVLPVSGAPVAQPSPVVVVHGDASLAEAGERRFAQSLARHAARWLHDAGIEADVVSDRALEPALLAGRRVAVLVSCMQPPPEQVQVLRRFTDAGGRLVVCYSSSPALAELMGVKPGRYLKDGAGGGRWAAMRFGDARPVNAPARVQQSSPNLFTVDPIAGRSMVLAWWEDRQGRTMPEPAWLVTTRGHWMSQVLLGEGEAGAKGCLLLSLAAAVHPPLWETAARHAWARNRSAGPLEGPAAALVAARSVADEDRQRAARQAALAAGSADGEVRRLLDEGRWPAAWLAAQDLRRAMLLAYGSLQEPRRGELRGVWDHSGQGLYPGDWPRTCRELKDAGLTDLFVNIGGPGFAHCKLAALPPSPVLSAQGDQLAACLAAAQPLGLRVHAWLICFSTTQATPERLAAFGRKGWLLDGTDGKPQPWLDPANPEVRAHLVAAATELVRRYRVDGVHLDFVRYPDYAGALGAGTRRRFEAARGKAVAGWPGSARQGAVFRELCTWRAAQVTDFVADTRLALRQAAPSAWLTAAVYGKYPSCLEAVGQDWRAWLERDLLDYAAPMNYTEQAAQYDAWVGAQTADARLARRILGGIGVTAAESRLDPATVIDQVVRLRRGRAAGFVLFDLDATLSQEVLPVLAAGVTAAPPERMGWWPF